jgi:hypothetical protein
MSAWIVSKAHIDALVSIAKLTRDSHYPFTDDELTTMGKMLWQENVNSINYRYPDTQEGGDYPGPADFNADYVPDYVYVATKPLPAAQLVKALSCYEYQSCEHPNWRSSAAFALCHEMWVALADTYIGSEGKWGLEEQDVR